MKLSERRCVSHPVISDSDVMCSCCDVVVLPEQLPLPHDPSVWQKCRAATRATTGEPRLRFLFILIGNVSCCSLLHVNKPKARQPFPKNSSIPEVQAEPGVAEQRTLQRMYSPSSSSSSLSSLSLLTLTTSLPSWSRVFPVMTTNNNPINQLVIEHERR